MSYYNQSPDDGDLPGCFALVVLFFAGMIIAALSQFG